MPSLSELLANSARKLGLAVETAGADGRVAETRREERRMQALHLEADYTVPQGAQILQFASTRQEAEQHRRAGGNSMASKAGAGPRRHMNTLNQPRFSQNSDGRRLPSPKLLTKSSTGTNVPPQKALVADGFRDDQGPPAKKQKTTRESPNFGASKVAIDLTEKSQDDKHFGPVIGRKSTRQSFPWDQDSQQALMSAELQSVDERMAVRPEKKKRKGRDASGSSQASWRDTPNNVALEPQPVHGRGRELGAVVVSAHDSGGEISNPARSTRRDSSTSKYFTSGNAVKRQRGAQHGEAQDIDATNAFLRSRMKSKAVAAGPDQRRARGLPDSWRRTVASQPSARDFRFDLSGSDSLRKMFVPITTKPPEPTVSRARERMKESSKVRTIAARLAPYAAGSEDELAGERTVPNSRSQSPEKSNAVSHDTRRQTRANQENDTPDPSDLQPTQFTSTARLQARQALKLQGIDDGMRIPIGGIGTHGRFAIAKGDSSSLNLVWHHDLLAFDLERNNVLQTSVSTHVLLSKAKAFARKNIGYATIVTLEGPVTATRHDGISVYFPRESKAWAATFIRCVQHATNDRVKEVEVCQEEFDEFLDALGSIDPDVRELWPKKIHEGSDELAAMKKRKLARDTYREDDEEKIRYEEDDELIQQTSRSATKSNVLRTNVGLDSMRRSSRQQKPVRPKTPTPPPPVRWTHENKIRRWSHSVVYPPKGLRRVTVDFEDLERLDEGEFLNDNIISFAMRQIEEDMAPEHKEKVHFFNSFFYTALTTKYSRRTFNYDAVKRWTKTTDLFTIPYIVVPINIDLHWFVAIICNLPTLSRKTSALENDEDDLQEEMLDDVTQDEVAESPAMTTSANVDIETRDTQESIGRLSISDDGKGSKLGKKAGRRSSRGPRKFNPDAPTIITLDSFGSSHATEIRFLKDYLKAEADAKRGIAVDPKDLQGMTAKGLPEQKNFCDCGVYVVGYIEEFAKNPKRFVTKVLQKELDQKADFANFDPSEKRAQIRQKLLDLRNGDPKAKELPENATSNANGTTSIPAKPRKTETGGKSSEATPVDAAKSDPTTKESRNHHDSAVEPASAMASSVSVKSSIGAEPAEDELKAVIPRAFEKPSSPDHTTTAGPLP